MNTETNFNSCKFIKSCSYNSKQSNSFQNGKFPDLRAQQLVEERRKNRDPVARILEFAKSKS